MIATFEVQQKTWGNRELTQLTCCLCRSVWPARVVPKLMAFCSVASSPFFSFLRTQMVSWWTLMACSAGAHAGCCWLQGQHCAC